MVHLGLLCRAPVWRGVPGNRGSSSQSPVLEIIERLGWLAFPTVAAVIVSPRPDNILGWMFCAVGVFAALGLAGEACAAHALVTSPGSLPGGVRVAATLRWGLCAPPVALTLILPLLFPDGRLPSRRWRFVCWLVGLAFQLLPIAAGIAVLKYHLYDIDLLINRTLVYALSPQCWPRSTSQAWVGAGASFDDSPARRATVW
jgi:hypothetical protein